MPVAIRRRKDCDAHEYTGGIVAKGNEQHLNDLGDVRTPGRVFTCRRSLPPVPGDSERYRAVELEIVPDAIREFIDIRRADAGKRAGLAR
jgi:hypothetical protein